MRRKLVFHTAMSVGAIPTTGNFVECSAFNEHGADFDGKDLSDAHTIVSGVHV
jgi:hypothetical protein